MIRIHHLGVSQSDRIVWPMEELGLPYELVWYDRKDGLAPPEYLARGARHRRHLDRADDRRVHRPRGPGLGIEIDEGLILSSA